MQVSGFPRFRLLLWAALFCLAAAPAKEAPPNLDVRIRPSFGRQSLVLDDQSYQTASGELVAVSRFRFYLTQLKLHCADESVYAVPNGNYLIDAEDTASLHIRLAIPEGKKVKALEALLGVDSATNTAGAGGGALDASRGMYWAWHSGYIHAKLEGTCASCRTRGHAYELHLGGFKRPHATQRFIRLPVTGSQLRLRADASALLARIALKDSCTVVEPGALAARIAQSFDRMLVPDED